MRVEVQLPKQHPMKKAIEIKRDGRGGITMSIEPVEDAYEEDEGPLPPDVQRLLNPSV